MLEVLVIGAGTDYGLFLVFRARENLRDGLDKREASSRPSRGSASRSRSRVDRHRRAALAAGRVVRIYSNLGIPLAIAIGIMLIAGLTLLPAVLAILGRAVFWPPSRARAAQDGAWGTLAARIVHRPAAVLSIGVVLFGALALDTLGYKSEGVSKGIAPPAGSDSAAGTTRRRGTSRRCRPTRRCWSTRWARRSGTDATPLPGASSS